MTKPRLIPVLDVMSGVVVRAVGGRREEYKPIRCPLSGSPRPVDIADWMASVADTNEMYVADLDAITGTGRITPLVENLLRVGQRQFWIDAGIRSLETFRKLPTLPGIRPVIGSETCPGPDVLAEILESAGPTVAFSLDLRAGEVIGNRGVGGWLTHDGDAFGVAWRAVELGVRTLIVLDLTRVGMGTGCGTELLLRAIRDEFPDVELIAGGGVRTWADIDRLGKAGANAVLVASALHDGTITFPRPS